MDMQTKNSTLETDLSNQKEKPKRKNNVFDLKLHDDSTQPGEPGAKPTLNYALNQRKIGVSEKDVQERAMMKENLKALLRVENAKKYEMF